MLLPVLPKRTKSEALRPMHRIAATHAHLHSAAVKNCSPPTHVISRHEASYLGHWLDGSSNAEELARRGELARQLSWQGIALQVHHTSLILNLNQLILHKTNT